MRSWKWYSKVLFGLVVAAFAWFVWPTPWKYLGPGIRVERITGKAWALDETSKTGWSPYWKGSK